jgi:asparagine synthase (glutamine-hydrolysing)
LISMPGIVGLISRMPYHEAEAEVQRMVTSIRHESSYQWGLIAERDLGVYAAWTAYSGSVEMPLKNSTGDVALVFSGEEFSTTGNDDGGCRAGNALKHLISDYEYDRTFPASLNGAFHGLLIDRARRAAMLFNDRYGMHRIYYHQSRRGFYFACECKAILTVCPDLRVTDSQSLGEFIVCGCVLNDRTLFRAIRVLPSASAWCFNNGSDVPSNKHRYFTPREWEQQETCEPEAYYRDVRSIFSTTVARYFVGTGLAMSLTGGLDTRAIMAWYKPGPGTMPCYTFGGMLRDCRDVIIARRVAQLCGQTHNIISVDQEFLDTFAGLAERTVYLAEGCVTVRHAADLYLNRLFAQTPASIRMTGNYGDEVFRRVRVLRAKLPPLGLFHGDLFAPIRKAVETYNEVTRGHPLSFTVFRQIPWYSYGLLALEQSQLRIRTPFLDNALVRCAFRAPECIVDNNQLRLRLIADGNLSLRRVRTDLGFGGSRGGMISSALEMLHMLSMKGEYAYDYGMPNWLARLDHALRPLKLERAFLGRHKFCHFRLWYREPLARFVKDVLLDRRSLTRPYLAPRNVQAMVTGHIKGNRNYTAQIHELLTLELFHRLFIDS